MLVHVGICAGRAACSVFKQAFFKPCLLQHVGRASKDMRPQELAHCTWALHQLLEAYSISRQHQQQLKQQQQQHRQQQHRQQQQQQQQQTQADGGGLGGGGGGGGTDAFLSAPQHGGHLGATSGGHTPPVPHAAASPAALPHSTGPPAAAFPPSSLSSVPPLELQYLDVLHTLQQVCVLRGAHNRHTCDDDDDT